MKEKDLFYKDIVITIICQSLVMILTFGVNKLVSINLSIDEYGLFSIGKRTATVLAYVMAMGMGIALPKYIPYEKEKSKGESFVVQYAYLLFFAASLVLLGFVLIFNIPLQKQIFGGSGSVPGLWGVFLYAFSLGIFTLIYAFYRAHSKFIRFNILQICFQFVNGAIIFIAEKDYINFLLIPGAVLSITGFCYSVLLLLKCKADHKKISLGKGIKKRIAKDMRFFSITRLPGEIIYFSFTALPLVMINQKCQSKVVGIVSAAVTINTMITPFFSFAGQILLPFASRAKAEDAVARVYQKVKILMKIYMILGVIMSIIIYLLAPLVIQLIFSTAYLDSVFWVRILIWSIIPSAYYLLLRNPIDAWTQFPVNTVNLLISFAVLIVGISISDHIRGFIFSYLIGYSLLGALSLISWEVLRRNTE